MINRKNKTSILIVLLIVAIALIGCGDKESGNTGATTSESAIETTQTTDGAITDGAISDGAITDDAVDENGKSADADSNDTTDNNSSSDSSSKKSSTKKKGDKKDSASSKDIKVTISIDCNTLYKKDPGLAAKVSNKGTILSKKTITLKKNATVLDALKATGISFTGTEYIKKINGLSEKDGGKLSGWMYKVNGEVPMESCDKYTLSGGENIQWKYTCDNGMDI